MRKSPLILLSDKSPYEVANDKIGMVLLKERDLF
jgi:hypothetical protein